MGLFSKEACADCGTEVGALGRTKLKDGSFICNKCTKKLTAYIHPGYITLDRYKEMVNGGLQAEEEAFTGSGTFDVNLGSGPKSGWMKYSSMVLEDMFTLSTNHSRSFEHQQVFHYSLIKPYQYKSEGTRNVEAMGCVRPDLNDYVQLIEEKESDGKLKGYTIKFPYDDEAIQKVEISAGANAKKDQLEDLVEALNTGKRRYFNNSMDKAEKHAQMQQVNAMKTASSMLSAAVKGGSVEDALKEGMERAEDISQDKYKKGLFGGLKRKK